MYTSQWSVIGVFGHMHDFIILLTLSVHCERVIVVVCLSLSDFGDCWQLTVDLGMNLLKTKIYDLLFCYFFSFGQIYFLRKLKAFGSALVLGFVGNAP